MPKKKALTTGKSRKKIKNKQKKVQAVMREFERGTLRSGKSRTGPKVTSRKQAIAIAMSEASLAKKSKQKSKRKKKKK